jgi:hypothetical protein
MNSDLITIVTGLPRSGTSMMMRMLEAGGMPVLTDNIRTPNEDNPEGYYEFERVKQIEHDQAWLEEAKGRAVKMVAALLKHLPSTYRYRVVFMRRDIAEVLASQRQMLVRLQQPTDAVDDAQMAAMFERHVQRIQAWLSEQPNVDVLYVDYGEVLKAPLAQAERLVRFLDSGLDAHEMARVVDPTLYRQRKTA